MKHHSCGACDSMRCGGADMSAAGGACHQLYSNNSGTHTDVTLPWLGWGGMRQESL